MCPGIVQFECVATNIETTLIWTFDDVLRTVVYVFDRMDNFPRTILDNNGVEITVLSAVQNVQNLDQANFTSTLTTNISMLLLSGVQTVTCGGTLDNDELQINNVMIGKSYIGMQFEIKLYSPLYIMKFSDGKKSAEHIALRSPLPTAYVSFVVVRDL